MKSKKYIGKHLQVSLALLLASDEFVASVYALLSDRFAASKFKDRMGNPYVEISQKEIASTLGISKGTVTRSIKALQDMSLIESYRATFGGKSRIRVYPLESVGIDGAEFIKLDLHLTMHSSLSLKCILYYGLRAGLSYGKMSRAKCAAKLGTCERTITNYNAALESAGLIIPHFVEVGKCLYIEVVESVKAVKTREQADAEAFGINYSPAMARFHQMRC